MNVGTLLALRPHLGSVRNPSRVRLFFVKALHFRENGNTAKTPRRQDAEEIFVVVAEALMLVPHRGSPIRVP